MNARVALALVAAIEGGANTCAGDAETRDHAASQIDMLIYGPNQVNKFEFVVVAALRAKQLARGCTPKVDGQSKPFITAQLEVLAGKVQKIGGSDDA